MSRKVPAVRKVKASKTVPAIKEVVPAIKKMVPASEKRRVIRCTYCASIFPYVKEMKSHPIKCPKCGNTFRI